MRYIRYKTNVDRNPANIAPPAFNRKLRANIHGSFNFQKSKQATPEDAAGEYPMKNSKSKQWCHYATVVVSLRHRYAVVLCPRWTIERDP
jgi:hypothetical protein